MTLTLRTVGPVSPAPQPADRADRLDALAARHAPRSRRFKRYGLVASCCWCGAFSVIRSRRPVGRPAGGCAWRWTPTPEEMFLAEPLPPPGRTTQPHAAGRRRRHPATRRLARLSAGPTAPGCRPRGDHVAELGCGTPKRALAAAGRARVVVGRDRRRPALYAGAAAATPRRSSASTPRPGERWVHTDPARFQRRRRRRARATPTFADGRLYTVPAHRDPQLPRRRHGRQALVAQHRRRLRRRRSGLLRLRCSWRPTSSSPTPGGEADKDLLAYRTADGSPAWTAKAGTIGYASPQQMTIDGRPHVVMLSEQGIVAVDPTSAAVLWEHAIPAAGVPRRAAWRRWDRRRSSSRRRPTSASRAARPAARRRPLDGRGAAGRRRRLLSFNNCVVRGDSVYGFDGGIFACVDLRTGKAAAGRGGRYGRGQVVMLADAGLMIVVTEGARRSCSREPRRARGTRPVPGDRGKDVEPPGRRPRPPLRATPRRWSATTSAATRPAIRRRPRRSRNGRKRGI